MTVSQHDPDARFDAFVREYGHGLLRTAWLLTHDEQASQDLLQDALERALREWPRRDIEFPAAYVRTIMVRLLQRQRLARRLRTIGLGNHEVPVSDGANGVDEREVLLSALAGLPARRRAAVVLRHWEGYSEAETAMILGCSVGTVKSQTYRGLLSLRQTITSAFPERENDSSAQAPPIPDLIGGVS